jgi:hypothetical protein
MENKYYTPEIEEFHVGFELEYNNNSIVFGNTWKKLTMNLEDFEEIENYKRIEYRVKYLDREDMESLGYLPWVKNSITHFVKDSIHIYFLPAIDENGPIVHIKDAVEDTWVFKGYIKNKSELKRILKMIGI